jgi:hypothetical protein
VRIQASCASDPIESHTFTFRQSPGTRAILIDVVESQSIGGAVRTRAPHFIISLPAAAMASLTTSLTPQARRTFQESFDAFERTVKKHSATDDRDFSDTTLRDVREAAVQIERQLAARQTLRNMKRLEPLLDALEAYSKVIGVLCNGTPFVSWVWVCLALRIIQHIANVCLHYEGAYQIDDEGKHSLPFGDTANHSKLATDNLGAFEKLMKAYSQIAELLPRLNQLSDALRDKSDFQQVLAMVYSDILEFHRHAYKFFRRNGQYTNL